MKQGTGRGKEGRDGKKEGEGGDGGPLCGKGAGKGREGRDGKKEGWTAGRFAAREWKGEGRKEREGGMGN